MNDLGGAGWTMREALGETWRWYVDQRPARWGNNVDTAARRGQSAPGWWPARVPGSVVTDLWRAGELPDPYQGRNTRAVEWTASRSWVYRRGVDLPAMTAGERAVLEFDGVDPSGSVFWDGQLLGTVPGLYHRARFTIPEDAARPGTHRLTVLVDPVPASQPQVGRTDLVRTHRPRMNEGWDFCPRFPHQGIWRGIRLVVGAVHASDLSVTANLNGDDGIVRATGVVDACTVELTVRDAAGAVVAQRREVVAGDLRIDVTVPRPDRWWPRGFGPPTLYTVRLRVADEPVWSGEIGFRDAELVRDPDAPAGALPYTAVVNGTVIPLVGWNWVPVDAQHGAVDPDRVRHLVDLAARSGARILRVWGGGLVETDAFYTACDRTGLLVWQEFSQSSSGMASAPATDEAFVRLMTGEAAAVVPPRTHHPSLFVWCGGNELDLDGVPLDEARSPVLTALRDTLRTLDPGRAWLPTSPSGPAFHYRDGGHDVHGPWEHQGLRAHYALANAGSCLAHTEFGVEGMTNARTLTRLLPAADRWPADRTNPAYRHLGDWWVNTPLVQECFRDRLTDLDGLIRASQLLQATGLAYTVEADRRRFPRCSIVLPWQLNEAYPNAFCTSCVDHRGDPKPAYHAVARAFAPRRVTVRVPAAVWAGEDRLTAQAWVWAEHGTGPGSRVRARLRSADGATLAEERWRVDGPVREPRPVGDLVVDAGAVPDDAAVVWDLCWESAGGEPLDREVMLACTGPDFAPLLELAPATLDVTSGGGVVTVVHRGGPMVVGLRLVDDRPIEAPGWVVADGDPRPLLPGERRRFTACGPLRLEAWNTPSQRIEDP